MDLVGFGNPLLDISSDVPEDLLTKYELKPGNAILAEEKHMPLYKELVDSFPVEYIAGGATQNSIRVAQWMMQTENATTFIGAVGEDHYGAHLREEAKKDGVNPLYLVADGVPTGTCAVLVVNKERSMVANLGACTSYEEHHLETGEVKSALGSASMVYIGGFFISSSFESMLKVAKMCAEQNKLFCINLSATFVIEALGHLLKEILPYADLVFGNEDEAAVFGKSQGWDGEDLKSIALKLSMMPKASGARQRVVVFTQGASATIVASNGEVEVFAVPKVPKENIVDTNGAGDSFVGGFLSGMALKKPLADCVSRGHYAASAIIQQAGCSLPKHLPTLPEE